jgi:hypothetical protein
MFKIFILFFIPFLLFAKTGKVHPGCIAKNGKILK